MMKTVSDYMSMNYRMEIVEDRVEGGFVASFPELPGCITCGETIEEGASEVVKVVSSSVPGAQGALARLPPPRPARRRSEQG